MSYRDPNLLKTVKTFDETVNFLRSTELRDEELIKSIIGTVGDMDKYLLPDAKGYTSLVRYLTDDTDEKRQRIRAEVLNTSVGDFRNFADVLEGLKDIGLVKVVGSASSIQST